jgi:hypothetical protein
MASTTLRRPACFRKYSWLPLDQSQTSTKWFLESSLKTQTKKSYFKTPYNNQKVAQVFHSRFSLTGQEWQTMCPGSSTKSHSNWLKCLQSSPTVLLSSARLNLCFLPSPPRLEK